MKTIDTFETYMGEVYRLVQEGEVFKIMRNYMMLHICDDKMEGVSKFSRLKDLLIKDGQVKDYVWKEVK